MTSGIPPAAASERQLASSIDHVHGTFGELLQGYTKLGAGFSHFLFTLPIVQFQVRARLVTGAVDPPSHRTRARAILTTLARETGVSIEGLSLDIRSNIPIGKGCSSSTSDVIATAIAFYQYFFPETPYPVASALASRIAATIEHGEYLLYPGIVACAQREHRVIRRYPSDLRVSIVGVDEGGTIDTAQFHRTHPEVEEYAQEYAALQQQMGDAISANDPRAVGQICTRSAQMHQARLPKRSLERALGLMREVDGYGVCIAHTGTMLGVLLGSDDPELASKATHVREGLVAAVDGCRLMGDLTLLEAQS